MEGSVTVEITVKQEIDHVVVRPLSLKIKPEVKGQKISFTLDSLTPVVVEVNGYHNALHLFPNPVQKEIPETTTKFCTSQCTYCSPKLDRIPKSSNQQFRYFGPGVHDIGTLQLQTGDSVYIAGGAVVYGCFIADDADNIRVWGRGVLDGSRIQRANRRIRGGFGCIHFRNSSHISVENCFIRSFDDCLVVRSVGSNLHFNKCVLWCDWGKSIVVAAESGAATENVVFENINMIRLSGTALALDHSCTSSVNKINFDNVNVEIDGWVARSKLQEAKDEKYVTNLHDKYCPMLICMSMSKTSRGTVDNILYKDIEVYGNTNARSSFRGFDAEHGVSNVTIKNLQFNSKLVEDAKQANLTIGPHVNSIAANAKERNVVFLSSGNRECGTSNLVSTHLGCH